MWFNNQKTAQDKQKKDECDWLFMYLNTLLTHSYMYVGNIVMVNYFGFLFNFMFQFNIYSS